MLLFQYLTIILHIKAIKDLHSERSWKFSFSSFQTLSGVVKLNTHTHRDSMLIILKSLSPTIKLFSMSFFPHSRQWSFKCVNERILHICLKNPNGLTLKLVKKILNLWRIPTTGLQHHLLIPLANSASPPN